MKRKRKRSVSYWTYLGSVANMSKIRKWKRWRGGMEQREKKSMFSSRGAESALRSLKHYGPHELLNTQYVYVIHHVRLLAESEIMLSLKH